MDKQAKRLYDIEYRKKNSEKIKAKSRDYYKKNRKKIINQTSLYQKINREKVNAYHREWYVEYSKKDNAAKLYKKRFPWKVVYSSAKNRCLNRKNHSYYKRKIPFKMTISDFKSLWFRDKAYLMERPSIDRKISKLGYVKSNCRFIEFQYNVTRKRKVN